MRTVALSLAAATILGLAACDGDDGENGMMQPPPTNQAPTATIAAPGTGSIFTAGQDVSFQGSASDPEDGALSGASLVWTSDLDGQIGTGASFTKSDLSVGTHVITLTATDSDGATGTATVQITVAPAGNQAPTASIAAPTAGAGFTTAENISFQGSGNDPEDGALSGASLVWTSDLDGQIGTGASFTKSDLSVGTHVITLTATDSDGATDAASVTITVQAVGAGQTIDLNIEDNAFVDLQGRRNEQADVVITLGTTLRWTYLPSGISIHTVTSGAGSGGGTGSGVPPGGTAFDSGVLSPGQTFTFTPDAVGTWTYFCQVHPTIMFNATITVVP
ncbi:MAG: PKD domain-containing protein [Gemmatimonadota bacterium]